MNQDLLNKTTPLLATNIADAGGVHSYLLSVYHFHKLRFPITSSRYSLPEGIHWLLKPTLHGHAVHLILATRPRSDVHAIGTEELPDTSSHHCPPQPCIFQMNKGNNISHPMCSSYSVNLTLLPLKSEV